MGGFAEQAQEFRSETMAHFQAAPNVAVTVWLKPYLSQDGNIDLSREQGRIDLFAEKAVLPAENSIDL